MFFFFSILAIVITCTLQFLILFEPGLKYHIQAPPHALDSNEFLRLLGALSDAQVHCKSKVDVLTNGSVFYDAELEAIRGAKRSINLEAYIFRTDAISQRFVDALAERAGNGVKVNLVVDAVGSFATRKKFFAPLTEA